MSDTTKTGPTTSPTLNLTEADLARFERFGIPHDLLDAAKVRRVTDTEAAALGILYKSEHLAGIFFPYPDPETLLRVTGRLRRDHPELDRDGKAIGKYLSPAGDHRHVYCPPGSGLLLADTSVTVTFVEAETSALALTAAAARTGRQLLAIGTGGSDGWRGRIGKMTDADGARVDVKGPLGDFDRVVWTDRDVVILFDSNAATNNNVQYARRALAKELLQRGAKVRIGDVPVEDGVNGPDDLRAAHGDTALFAVLDSAQPAKRAKADDPDVDESKKESQATAIVRLVTDAGAELWHTPDGDGYLTIMAADHREHWPLASRGARDYLTRLYYIAAGRAPHATALQDAIATLGGIARFDGPEHLVSVRVGEHGGAIYLDLADATWRVVEITREGWRVTADAPIRFRRPRGVLPLPAPEPGGSITTLKHLLNVVIHDDLILIVGWLLAALRPRGPYPVLVLTGEQGAAKSTTARVLRQLVDPSVSDLRAEPREVRDIMIAATSGYVVALDNISRLQPWLSDALCRLSTGGGFSTRQLYTDGDEIIFDAMRPAILTGISTIATRGDLVDRAIVVTLPPVPDDRRRTEADLWAECEAVRPQLLGALLDAVAAALRRLDEVHLDHLPRMADFALWVVAAESACPWLPGAFLAAYASNRQGAVEVVLDGDVLADVVRALGTWQGTASELFAELNRRAPDDLKRRKDWFSRPRQVADALRRLAPALRRVGIDVTFGEREAHTRRRIIAVEKVGADASPSSPSSPSPDFRPVSGDAGGTQGDARGPRGDDASPDASPDLTNVSGLGTEGDAGDDVAPRLSYADEEDADVKF
jgi:hypothetical protein